MEGQTDIGNLLASLREDMEETVKPETTDEVETEEEVPEVEEETNESNESQEVIITPEMVKELGISNSFSGKPIKELAKSYKELVADHTRKQLGIE